MRALERAAAQAWAPWEARPIKCEWAIGSFPGGEDVMAWASARAAGVHLSAPRTDSGNLELRLVRGNSALARG